jgi:hypothetical protein
MDARVSRREMLALSAVAALAPTLLSCSTSRRISIRKSQSEDDPLNLSSYGYDPEAPEPAKAEPPKRLDHVPQSASVKTDWLPPVGRQTMGNCFVWASAYGLSTFNAARKSQTPPTSSDRQAGPDYAYIRYEMARKIAGNTCNGGQVGAFLDWLKSNGGTPSLAAAPNYGKQGSRPSCNVNWSKYGSRTIPADSRFVIPDYKVTQINGADGLQNLRTVLASGSPMAFGTSLYTDFKKYRGKPAPYVGNGEFLRESNGKKSGHVMLIVGYDDSKGAVRIQNSWGKNWGDKGFLWMAYDTLEKLAQGKGFYLPESA